MDKVRAILMGAFVILVLTGMVGGTAHQTSVGETIEFLSAEEYAAITGAEAPSSDTVPVQPLGFNS